MKKKKLFIYIHQSALRGGVEKVFYNLFQNLPDNKYEITVLNYVVYLTNDLKQVKYKGQKKRLWFYYDEISTKPFIRFIQRIHNKIMPTLLPVLLKLQKYDIAIAAQEGMYAKFVEKNIRAKKKLLWIHNDMLLCRFTEKHFSSPTEERQCYLQFDKVVCVSESVKDTMLKRFGEMGNLCVCFNPIDTNEIDCLLREGIPNRPKETLFVCVGRLVEQKGFDRLLPICKKLNDEGFRYHVWIIGEGEDRKKLEAYISDNNLSNVELLGYKSNPFIYMKCADWFLCVSRFEGFNMTLQEATYCGTPIITTLCAGAQELLSNNEFGIIVDNSEAAIDSILHSVLSDKEINKTFKKRIMLRKSFVALNERIKRIDGIMDIEA